MRKSAAQLDPGLVHRWQTADGRKLRDEVVLALRGGSSLAALNLPTVDGRVDLRGLPASEALDVGAATSKPGNDLLVQRVTGNLELRRVHLAGLDLSGAALHSLRLFDVTAEDCRFDGVEATGWRAWAIEFRRCTFIGAQLPEASLGAGYEGRTSNWTDIDLSGADLRASHGSAELTFERCRFDQARLHRANFSGTGFIDCHFAGVLRNVEFNARWWKDPPVRRSRPFSVDFSEAVLSDVDFRNIDFEDVVFPMDPDHVVLEPFRCVAAYAFALLQGSDGPERGWAIRLAFQLTWGSEKQRRGFINMDDFARGTDERATLLRILSKARELCQESRSSAAVDAAIADARGLIRPEQI